MNAENKPKRLGEILIDEGVITNVPLVDALDKLNVVNVEDYYDTELYHGRRKGILTNISPGIDFPEPDTAAEKAAKSKAAGKKTTAKN